MPGRKPSFTLEQSEGGIKKVFDAFYRQGGRTKEQADVQLLFRKGSGLYPNSPVCKKVRQFLIENKYLQQSPRNPQALIIDGYWKPETVASEFYAVIMGTNPPKPVKPEVIEVPKVIKETLVKQEVFSDATGFGLKWMESTVYYIQHNELRSGVVTGFRTRDDLKTIDIQIDGDLDNWIPQDHCYNSLEDFKKFLERSLKKL